MSIHKGTKCPKHNLTFYGPICPQCIKDEDTKQFEKIIEPLKKAELRREAREQLRLILTKLENATLVKETPSYRLSVCPYCGRKSLFFHKSRAEYECLNPDDSLTISIRYYTEKSDR
jgi:glutaredoxin